MRQAKKMLTLRVDTDIYKDFRIAPIQNDTTVQKLINEFILQYVLKNKKD